VKRSPCAAKRASGVLAAGFAVAWGCGLAASSGCSGTGSPASPETPALDAFEADASLSADADAEACTLKLPACPDAAPSWSASVSTIVSTSCGGCHQDGGIEEAAQNFSTYALVHKQFGAMLSNVLDCQMPPPDAAPLSPADTETLLEWLVCAAPNN
jgi:hypothetical protein